MKIQNSRNSKQGDKDYSAVCHQQGRMITDFDLNEQALISRDRLNQALKDVIGSGTPRCDALLQVNDENIPRLHWGIVYVDGIRAEARVDKITLGPPIEAPVDFETDVNFDAVSRLNPIAGIFNNNISSGFNYSRQLYYPKAPALPQTPYCLYVDVWDRTVTWLEDEKLRDPGLYGADTTTRTQTMAQVKWCNADTDPMCLATIGNARLHLRLRSLSSNADPCDPCAEELELNDPVGNYHFRAEVHDVHYDKDNNADAVVLKWSSENGAEAYHSGDIPPDLVSSQYVYEFFSDITEKHLGIHLARDINGDRAIDGKRSEIVNNFPNTPPNDYVRRWNGWCRIEKIGSGWRVIRGFEGPFDLNNNINSGAGKVIDGGSTVTIELDVITLKLELSNHAFVAGDYWNTAVRAAIHKQGDILLKDENSVQGALPNGEQHHYFHLVNVAENGTMSLPTTSDCDKYKACQPPQFPSLTDIRADDICFDNSACEMTEATTVQGALDQLCKKNDLPWHNKHLHGWGIVCGLALQCNKENPSLITLKSGYALDCEGHDMVIENDINIDVIKGIRSISLSPQLDENQGVCLYLHRGDNNQITVQCELYEDKQKSLLDKLQDSLLFDFYNDCVVELIATLKAELTDTEIQVRCAITACGNQFIPALQRRTLALTNILFHKNQNQANTVLNVSRCEHELLKNQYDNLQDLLRSKTFCGQFKNSGFPEFPFIENKIPWATWLTPEKMDHFRAHPNGKLLFAWQRNSQRIFVFKQTNKRDCTGDLIAKLDVPAVTNGSISDLFIDKNNKLHIAAIVHKKNSLFARTEFNPDNIVDCTINAEWQTSFINNCKIVKFQPSPWSDDNLFAVALCKGIYHFNIDELFSNDLIDRPPSWEFPASGHMAFDLQIFQVFATAYVEDETVSPDTPVRLRQQASCKKGLYNRLVFFNFRDSKGEVQCATPIVSTLLSNNPTESASSVSDVADTSKIRFPNTRAITGDDGFVLAATSATIVDPTPVSPDDTALSRAAAVSPTIEDNVTRPNYVLFLVGSFGDQKYLYRFNSRNLQQIEGKQWRWQGFFHHNFAAAGRITLGFVNQGKLNGILATRYNLHDLQYIPADPKLYSKGLLESIPVQAGPIGIINNNSTQQIFVLNHLGQSFTAINHNLHVYQSERAILQKYRNNVNTAFTQLLSGVVQYLKDCFCQHLLVDCPECKEDDKVYLGSFSMRDNEVYNICNFTKRKYVKTFPTVSYWLSLLPVAPVVAWIVEKFCCQVLPGFNSQSDSSEFTLSQFQRGISSALVNSNAGKAFFIKMYCSVKTQE
ncbi:MAG: hypothetical protein JKY19_14475 [Alcanivoracaceae bacterium]|nr:hypothetical protein [Alcanivoracaceae bacterium]